MSPRMLRHDNPAASLSLQYTEMCPALSVKSFFSKVFALLVNYAPEPLILAQIALRPEIRENSVISRKTNEDCSRNRGKIDTESDEINMLSTP